MSNTLPHSHLTATDKYKLIIQCHKWTQKSEVMTPCLIGRYTGVSVTRGISSRPTASINRMAAGLNLRNLQHTIKRHEIYWYIIVHFNRNPPHFVTCSNNFRHFGACFKKYILQKVNPLHASWVPLSVQLYCTTVQLSWMVRYFPGDIALFFNLFTYDLAYSLYVGGFCWWTITCCNTFWLNCWISSPNIS